MNGLIEVGFMSDSRFPTWFVSHGGGPWPWMNAPGYSVLRAAMESSVRGLAEQPRAVLMLSAHWEEPAFVVQTAERPGMVYDYGGFPAHTYEISYSAPGDPELAARVIDAFTSAGLPCGVDPNRGFDHGAFVPLGVMFPAANVPVVQCSIHSSFDPALHLAAGQALAPLRDEGVLIIGSGLTFHNLSQFGVVGAEASRQFETWLSSALIGTSANEREEALRYWDSAPGARMSHPRPEHLLPLMMVAGAAGDDICRRSYFEPDFMGSITVASYAFEPASASSK